MASNNQLPLTASTAPGHYRPEPHKTAAAWSNVRRLLPLLALVTAFTMNLVGYAQTSAPDLESLTVEIWPDYDRPAALVLLTGTLAEQPQGPVTFTIPLPEDVTLNAVARVDQQGAMLTDQVSYDDGQPGQLQLTLSDQVFRIEYYMPYVTEGDQHIFDFNWESDLAIDQVIATVQQPAVARDMTITPEPASVTTGRDGLQYHSLPITALAPGQTYSIDVAYTMTNPELSTNVLGVEQSLPTVSLETSQAPATRDSGLNLPLILAVAGGLLVIAAVIWLVFVQSSSRRRVVKPRPVRSTSSTSGRSSSGGSRPAKFCHNCGEPVESGDRFCSNCGTALKGN